MKRRHALHRSQGQSVVVVALTLVVLVAMAGLGLDGANAFNQRRNASNAADAAAMAGTSALLQQRKQHPTGPNAAVYAAVADYLTSHGIDASSNTWKAYYVDRTGERGAQVTNTSSAVPEASTGIVGIAVDLNYRFNTLFMQILGRTTLPVSATATAIYGPLGTSTGGRDILPVTVSKHVALDMKSHPDAIAIFGTETGAYKGTPGAFGGVNLIPNIDHTPNGNSSTDCPGPQNDNARSWWCNGTAHKIRIGDQLLNNPGQVSNALITEIKWRADHKSTALVPVFGAVSCCGANTKYTIVGFLAVQLLNRPGQSPADIVLTGTPEDRHISAKYIDYYVTVGAINTDPNALDTGVYAVNLIK